MKKLLLLFLVLLIPLTSCFQQNEIYVYNKKVLDDNYETNTSYAVITGRTYKSADKIIDFGNLIDKQIKKDGKNVELIYNTRFVSYLVEDNIYFFYEYKRVESIGKFAVGYLNLNTTNVYVDYFEHERTGFSWDYLFSTDEFVAYKFYEYDGIRDIKIVFFKDTNKLVFDYDLNNLEYNNFDLEEVQNKDYYIQDDIKYNLSWDKLTNTNTGDVITLPNGNELSDTVPIIKEIYDKFTYKSIDIYLTYLSNGDELFFYIQDRPTNSLNAPFMLFKCNLDLSDVSYIGYYDHLIFNVISLKNNKNVELTLVYVNESTSGLIVPDDTSYVYTFYYEKNYTLSNEDYNYICNVITKELPMPGGGYWSIGGFYSSLEGDEIAVLGFLLDKDYVLYYTYIGGPAQG